MNGEAYILIEVVIALSAAFLISALINVYQRHQLKQVKLALDDLTEDKRQLKLDLLQETELDELNASAELRMLGELSNDQRNEIWRLENALVKAKLDSDTLEQTGIAKTIHMLKQSVQFSHAHINHLNFEINQTKDELAKQQDQSVQIKKLKDNVASLTLHESTLLKQVAALNEELATSEKELKRFKQEQGALGILQVPGKNDSKQVEELNKKLIKVEEQLKRTEAERTLLENHYIELDEHSGDSRKLSEELQRLKKEYAMLEQRFVGD